MHLPPSIQDSIATQIASYIRLNTIGYGAVAARAGRSGHPEAAIVAIVSIGRTDCTAKVAVHHNKLVYTSATGTHITYPARWSDAGRIVRTLLLLENK
mgnify:CR=1 FL=1|jgi:hypothetical protein|nr:MAG TPA: hypothetical protein [Caudoviricetes sp.]